MQWCRAGGSEQEDRQGVGSTCQVAQEAFQRRWWSSWWYDRAYTQCGCSSGWVVGAQHGRAVSKGWVKMCFGE